MLVRFVIWFLALGLSIGAQYLLDVPQGLVFLWIYLGASVVTTLWIFLSTGKKALAQGNEEGSVGVISIGLILTMLMIVLMLGGAWVASLLLPVDIFIAYELMTFGMCFVSSPDWDANSKKLDNAMAIQDKREAKRREADEAEARAAARQQAREQAENPEEPEAE